MEEEVNVNKKKLPIYSLKLTINGDEVIALKRQLITLAEFHVKR